MIARIDERGGAVTAIAPVTRQRANVVEFAANGIAADVRVAPAGRRGTASMYSLRLASVHLNVTGRLIGVVPGGELVDLGGLAVAAGSVGGARMGVAPPGRAPFESVYLEIVSDGVLLRVEAPKPKLRRRPRAVTAAATLFAGGTLAIGGAFLASAWPQTPLLSGPVRAVAGSAVRLPYTTHGYGTLTYAAAYDDGTSIGSGVLAAASGVIALDLPPDAAHRRVSVALAQRSTLGSASAGASFAVDPAPAARETASSASVISFAVRRDREGAGETVLASYLAVADDGTIGLFDSAGKPVASVPFAHVGTSRIAVPAAFRAAPLVAKITVRRGRSSANASIALAAAPASAPDVPVAETAQAEAVTPVESFAQHALNPGIVAVDGSAVAGRALRLRFAPHAAAMHVELQDETGESLAETDVPAAHLTAALPLPPSASAQTYSLVVRYTRSGAEETVLRTVLVRPR